MFGFGGAPELHISEIPTQVVESPAAASELIEDLLFALKTASATADQIQVRCDACFVAQFCSHSLHRSFQSSTVNFQARMSSACLWLTACA